MPRTITDNMADSLGPKKDEVTIVEWKQYMTIEVWTLIVAIATFIVSVMSYRYSRKKDNRSKQEKIRRKEAQLKAMEESMRWGIEHSAAAHLRVEISGLRAEIEQLKNDL